MYSIYLWTVLAPLIGAIVAGLFGRVIGRAGAHWVTIVGVAIATVLSFLAFKQVVWDGGAGFNGTVYVWGIVGDLRLEIGFLIDELSATMMLVVSFVSLMIHIYTIGYMADDPGYQRFFSYISLFTFSMLMLVMSNNFFQLFFGWEAVGVVSYLLIGFWYQRESAIRANLKAFLVNRVGDFGFILGIAAVLLYFDSLDYATVFERAPEVLGTTIEVLPGSEWSVMTLIGILLFTGAMGKSAQFPLHVWLPDSMEGPTPISALIHAATMVTAGIFMVARMSPLFELSDTALTMVMWIGAITALFMGVLGLVQKDIKRVIAYSTLSQLRHPCILQGAAVPGRGLGDYRHAPRAGRAQDGRSVEAHAHNLVYVSHRHSGAGGLPGLLGLLFQGRHYRGRQSIQSPRRRNRLPDGSRQRPHHVPVFLPSFVPGLPWK
jgi:NADH-quinone oxidoreductase subunit L